MKNQQFYVKTARLAVPIMMQNMITIGVNMADNIMVGSRRKCIVRGGTCKSVY